MRIIELNDVNEKVYYDKCKSGLEIYVVPNKNVIKFYTTLSVRYGSIHTKFKINNKIIKSPDGIAHFLEHQMFNEPDGTTAHEKFAKLGSYINAGTSFDYTSYEVYGTNNIKKNIDNLLDYVYSPYFIEKNVNKEKGIICEEIKMYDDSPNSYSYYKLAENVFSKSNYRVNIAGSIEEVKRTTAKDINVVYDAFYHPKNMFIVVTGNVIPEEIIAIVKENMDKRVFREYSNCELLTPKEPYKIIKKEETIELNVDIPRIHLAYKIPKSRLPKNDINCDKFIVLYNRILSENFGVLSELNEELKEKNIINSEIVTSANDMGDYLILKLFATTMYPNELSKIIFDKMKKLKFDNDALKRLQRGYVADRVRLFEDIVAVNEKIFDDILNYKTIIPSYKEIYKGIKLNKINDYIKLIDLENYSILYVNPKQKIQ